MHALPEGLPWVERILRSIEDGQGKPGDLDKLASQTNILGPGNTFCALAPGAVEPLQSATEVLPRGFRAPHR